VGAAPCLPPGAASKHTVHAQDVELRRHRSKAGLFLKDMVGGAAGEDKRGGPHPLSGALLWMPKPKPPSPF
jgi:hypothetical protein